MASIDGLISGLNTETIINGLMAFQQSKLERLNLRKAEIQVKQRAMQGVEARLLSLRSQMSALNRNVNDVFSTRQVRSSHEQLVSASATNRAVIGSYTLRIMSRAQAHQIASESVSSSAQEITTGVITIQVGDRPANSITIDGSNNSVAGLVHAINSQSTDVSATLVRDQANNSERIVLTSRHTGAANAIVIDNQLADSQGNAIRPDFSGMAVQEPTNAVIQLGVGPGAITAAYATNQINDLIAGVTLNVNGADTNQEIVINVTRDTSQAAQAIKDFVAEFNSLMAYLDEQTKFDAATQMAGPLLGNRSVTTLKNQMLSLVTGAVPGLASSFNRLSQIGVTVDTGGRLSVDTTRLNTALQGTDSNINPDDVARLFRMTGVSTNPGVEFVMGSAQTKAAPHPYQVDIVQAAERASVLGTNALDDTITIDNHNRHFQITLDGVRSEVLALAEGSYTPAQLAFHVQSVINSSTKLGNRQIIASIANGQLQLTSLSYGSVSKISEITGTAAAQLGFVGNEQGVGKDVVGSFIVNGVTEAATGSGRLLIGNSGNQFTADLQVRVTLDATQVHAGIESDLTVTRGATSLLDQFLADFVDSEKGTLASSKASFQSQQSSMDASIERVNRITAAKREYLIKQFAALERALSALQATSSIVATQLANLQSPRK